MPLSKLEQERAARIAANQQRLQEIGLLQTVQTIATAQTAVAAERRARVRASKAARRAVGTGGGSERRVRRSERVAGIDAPNYNENAALLCLADGGVGGGGSRDRRLIRDNVREEVYGVEHLDALGSHKQEWELFVDGYNASGERIYDKVNGQTCHQCRQKTLGKRTCCSGCGSLQGVLCGDCLFMRYGENVDEAAANPDWLCPLCRDICNCSFHRSKRGWAPTGTLYRHAIAEGYTSVAHFLVLNNLSEEAKPVALERGLCPPELAAELAKEIKEAGNKVGAASEAGSAAAAEEAAAAAAAAKGAEQQPPAVQEQLLQPEEAQAGAAAEAEQEPAAAAGEAPPRRSARDGSSSTGGGAASRQAVAAPAGKGKAVAAAKKQAVVVAVPRKRKQGSIQLALAGAEGKKQKGGAAAAEAPARRGLRSSERVRS